MTARLSATALALVIAAVIIALGGWWLLGGWVPGQSGGLSAAGDALQRLDPQVVAGGRTIYQANCASCHGAGGEGAPNWKTRNPDNTLPPPPHDSSGHTWHHSDGLLYRIVRDGGTIYESPGFKSAMPAWGDRLTHEEIVAAITYLKSLWGSEERAVQEQMSRDDPFPPGEQ